MCGRFFQDLLEEDLQEYFDTKVSSHVAEAARVPRYNIGPGQDIWVVRLDKEQQRSLDTLHWGLIPHFAKDKKGAYRMINARAETLDKAPSYRTAFAKRRCIVVARGFYEWRKLDAKHKQPYAIARPDRAVLALAGIWENWRDDSTGEWLRSVAIVTTEANDTLGWLHDRMPVVLQQQDIATWLGEHDAAPAQLKALLRPSPEPLELWPVDPRMNKVQVEDPRIIEPIALAPEKRA